eukprot:292468-Alexandrium_andersonii.AAC.1
MAQSGNWAGVRVTFGATQRPRVGLPCKANLGMAQSGNWAGGHRELGAARGGNWVGGHCDP